MNSVGCSCVPGPASTSRACAAPLVPGLIYQLCSMVMPQPAIVNGPNPEEGCRPLDRPPRVLIEGKPIALDRVWVPTAGQPGGITLAAAGPGVPTPWTHISITVPEQDRRDER